MDGPELRAQSSGQGLGVGEVKVSSQSSGIHSAGLECALLPSSTQTAVCTSVSAGGREGSEKKQKTWVSNLSLLRTSCVT